MDTVETTAPPVAAVNPPADETPSTIAVGQTSAPEPISTNATGNDGPVEGQVEVGAVTAEAATTTTLPQEEGIAPLESVKSEQPIEPMDTDPVPPTAPAIHATEPQPTESLIPVGDGLNSTLKRSSPDTAGNEESERLAKRVKDNEGVESMVVDSSDVTQPTPSSEAKPEVIAPTDSAPAPQPSPINVENPPQSMTAASTSEVPAPAPAPVVNGQPNAHNPVSDPALLPPQNLYLPGSYLPPVRPPLGATIPLIYQQYRSLLALLKTLRKQKEAFAFQAPVDPVLLGIPHYGNIITKPMDLQTVESKLVASNPGSTKSKASPAYASGSPPYSCVADVVNDVRQVWANTRIFNGPEHLISLNANKLEELFEVQLEKQKLHENPAPPSETPDIPSYRSQGSVHGGGEDGVRSSGRRPSVSQPTIRRNPTDELMGESSRPRREIHPPTPKDSTWVEPVAQVARTGKRAMSPRMKAANRVINELLTKTKYKHASAPFQVPVDPIALGIPAYFDVIKKPMDLSTILNKIANDEYESVGGVDKDIKLMIRNCFTFNPPATPVHVCGEEFQKLWNEKYRNSVLTVPEHEPSAPSGNGSAAPDEEDLQLDRQLADLERQRDDINKQIDAIQQKKAERSKAKSHKTSHAHSASKSGKASSGASARANAKSARPSQPKGASGSTGGGPKAKKANGASRRSSDIHRDLYDSDDDEIPTLAQKQELADKIADADSETLMMAVDLIQKTTSLGSVSVGSCLICPGQEQHG